MANAYNPFQKWKMGFKPLNATPGSPGGGQTTPANSTRNSLPDETVDSDGNVRGSLRRAIGSSVDLPRNLYAPPGSQSLELTTFNTIAAGSGPVSVLRFVAPLGAATQILGYAFTTTGTGFTNFTPTVNGFRVFPFNGDPGSGFALFVPTGPDLTIPITAQLPLKPGDILEWFVDNTDAAPHAISIRTTGYVISSIRLEDTRFGG